MAILKTKVGRRSFLKTSALAGGGLMISFSWLASCKSGKDEKKVLEMPDEWFELNGYLKIGNNGVVTIMSPNPEIGQNVKTSMPMIVAEELDVDWETVIVEQAPLNTDLFTRQLAGGSQSIRQGWNSLRMAGATARDVLRQAAAKKWNVPKEEVTTSKSVLEHKGKKLGYGEVAAEAASMTVPEEVELKNLGDFTIVGTPKGNVDGKKIVTGKPLYGIDIQKEGMLYAMMEHPPAFGMKLKSFDATEAKAMPGIKDVFSIKSYQDDYQRQWSDVSAFSEFVVVVGNSTWEVLSAKKKLKVEWEKESEAESTADHLAKLDNIPDSVVNVARKDGDPEKVFKNAAKVIERTYTAPFLSHNTMEPMNFFAHVTADKAEFIGPIQTPEFMEKSASARLGLPLEKIDIQMTRMGGGFGRRLYGHFLIEAGVISQKMNAPVKLVYTREDDMTFGTYRPAYRADYKAALDENNNLIAFHVKAGGIPESPLFANRFPAGAVDNYLAESWVLESNISVGAFRAPRSNFIAGVEQAFIDEVAEAAGKDPIDFRLELMEKAKNSPVGKDNDYDAERYAGVLRLVREKSKWGTEEKGVHRGVSAYFCHNSYVANVVDLEMKNNEPVIKKVYCAVDCGIVVNPIAATNLVEGGTIDGIGHAMYSAMTFKDGKPDQKNFDTYRLIRHSEAPKDVEVHFVKSDIDPTGLGEPPFPPVIGALANALYKANGKRTYSQPFLAKSFQLG
ncbi:molybdopterin-dependent oxidoreductase [Fulvivirga maritima]|uniref:xanthine dehydrogenase family protein molybdopterin-binding subunit n=1 Tax=Fulvivirga maritima TaxID=2904247 RepID=UPI001F1645B4|nr:molybdopterin cofactor-binding domain-containing protein [Fulvivirga maritima]UII26336.1 molybdopterin-dependent oxidoreductase [Fulvivirga maritima]